MLAEIDNDCMKFLHVAKFRLIHKPKPPSFVHQYMRGEQKQVQPFGCIPPEWRKWIHCNIILSKVCLSSNAKLKHLINFTKALLAFIFVLKNKKNSKIKIYINNWSMRQHSNAFLKTHCAKQVLPALLAFFEH